MLTQHITPSEDSSSILTAKKLNFNQTISPETVFSCFSDEPWSMWLDSCNSEHIDSQFDILVWQPQVTLSTNQSVTDITHHNNNTHQRSTNDALTLVNEAIEQVFSSIKISDTINLPFKGGAVGYFSYDLGRQFEVLPEKCIHDISIADMSIGIYTQAIIFDNKTQSFYLVCLSHERNNIEHTLNEKLKSSTTDGSFCLTSNWRSNMSKAQYTEKFNQVHHYLLSGDCYQINLAQRFSAQYTGDEFTAYKTLRKENNAPFSAFIKLQDSAILSISPERFLQLKDQKVQSKPIKGTRPRHTSNTLDEQAAAELKVSTKDKAENLMIVDLLRNDISKVCQAGSVVVPKLFDIESFPAVHHLVSTVEGTISHNHNATDLLRGAFPGGSITGAPKIRAMEIIEELEPHRRSVYCGSIGYISACGDMDTSITIRTLVCENNTIHCWAGGGLVADSVLDNEYQETFDKVNKILPILKETI